MSCSALLFLKDTPTPSASATKRTLMLDLLLDRIPLLWILKSGHHKRSSCSLSAYWSRSSSAHTCGTKNCSGSRSGRISSGSPLACCSRPRRPSATFPWGGRVAAAATQTSDLQQRTVIDGQQRLTTLQLLLDALHAEIAMVARRCRRTPGAAHRQRRAFCRHKEDRFKVWPTNRDRPAFNEVMEAPNSGRLSEARTPRVAYGEGTQFFAQQCRQVAECRGPEKVNGRAEAIERSARELLQIVVIDLTATENAQEIFETLNARGAVLTAADLIKNFVFQRLLEQGADVEEAYEQVLGAVRDGVLGRGNQRWASQASAVVGFPEPLARGPHRRRGGGARSLLALQGVRRLSGWPTDARSVAGDQSRRGDLPGFHREGRGAGRPAGPSWLFAYRVKTLESEVIKPVLLALLDHKAGPPARGAG